MAHLLEVLQCPWINLYFLLFLRVHVKYDNQLYNQLSLEGANGVNSFNGYMAKITVVN